MGKTVSQLEYEMPASEFVRWFWYYEAEPFGQIRDNVHAAKICSILANVYKKKEVRAFSEMDFIVDPLGKAEKEKTENRKAGVIPMLMSLAKKGEKKDDEKEVIS